jgi:hypothetical protein
MPRTLTAVGTALAGLALTVTVGTSAIAAGAGTIVVPQDFVPSASDTRATGHYEVVGTGLRVWTDSNTSTDKVAEYVATSTPLVDAGEPSLDFTNTSGGGIPGMQLVVDLDNDGTADGILVGEPTYYGSRWWASNPLKAFVATHPGATAVPSNDGYTYSAPLDTWRQAYPDAQVRAFGFSLGSGVKGDGVINAITFAGTRHTFAPSVTLTSKDQCKNGGWATSTAPVYKNQGDCVSSFAAKK